MYYLAYYFMQQNILFRYFAIKISEWSYFNIYFKVCNKIEFGNTYNKCLFYL